MVREWTRRDLLATGGAVAAGGVLASALGAGGIAAGNAPDGWGRAAGILARVRPPHFPNRDFLVTAYGAAGDGHTDCTRAFAAAITDCTNAGGGRVVVPTGTFSTGAIHLKSKVNLHLTADATISFSRDRAAYLPVVYTRYEGVELFNHSAPIYAYRQRNIAITGSGIIDGRADSEHWWNLAGSGGENPDKAMLNQMAEDGVPVAERVFGEGHNLRVNLIQLYECENILIDGVTVMNSPMWHIHPVLSRNVLIQNVTIDTPEGPNTDGIDPESCTDVLIRRCSIRTGDDCIAFKAGKDADGRRVNVPSEYGLVEDCEMQDGNGGVTVGSETSGSVRYIFARNCTMSSPNLERAIRVKTNPNRGGEVEHLYFRNIRVGQAADAAVEIALNYANVNEGSYYPRVRDIDIRNVRVESAERALYLIGNDGNPIRDVRLTNCVFVQMAEDNVISNVEGLELKNVTIGSEPS